MSLTNPSSASGASGPGSGRTNALKRTVQASFETPTRNMGPQPYQPRYRVRDKYKIMGFISSGTYGRVYKATDRSGRPGEFAIKKFKPDKEGEQLAYTGISQSAIREMSLCTELRHANVVKLIEIILEPKCIYIVFEFCEHDLLQIIHHHTQHPRRPIMPTAIKSIMFQLLNGCLYLHTNWILHRDLKPANIMVSSSGEVKIGDLGLARQFSKPLHSLFNGDKVVVTIWYRAPELILGSHHYGPPIDMWAVGCIFAELLSLRPIFKGEEAKMDSKKTVPFQRSQMQKIVDIMGMPTRDRWPLVGAMPEAGSLSLLMHPHHHHYNKMPNTSLLEKWYMQTINGGNTPAASSSSGTPCPLVSLGAEGYRLLAGLLEYDPQRRLTAAQALQHPFFSSGDRLVASCFEGLKNEYPLRRISPDDEMRTNGSIPGSKRSGLHDDSLGRASKRLKE
ncbi:cyclin-dependent protein kinase [Ceratocystis pirilliformis]|uniref:Serine/threonine-protein kinase SSN3 n=1 Tax=Ceratocystis pirilliformis TaxID=259994 RepID=A0ABR3ZAV9_9PEZI